jgi:DNA-binding NarL/FixJ family response regulator
MRILLADHRASLRSALRLLLEQEAQIEVVGEAGNVGALPHFVSRLRPDLLFLDWHLPGLESHSTRQHFLDAVRAIDPNLYIIALTNDDNAISCLSLGADAYVNKAEPPEQILAVLRQAVSRELSPPAQSADGRLLM